MQERIWEEAACLFTFPFLPLWPSPQEGTLGGRCLSVACGPGRETRGGGDGGESWKKQDRWCREGAVQVGGTPSFGVRLLALQASVYKTHTHTLFVITL